MPDISQFPKYHIYCDESSQTKNRYLVIGSVFCAASMARKIARKIDLIIQSYGNETELKWAKFKRMNAPLYREVYSAIRQMIEANFLQVNLLVVDSTKLNHRLYNDGDRDLGFTKFLFTLLYKYARTHSQDMLYHVFLDDRTTKHTPEKLKWTLNAKVRKETHKSYEPYRLVQFVDSKKSRLVQIADLLSGLVAYDTNMHYLALDAARHKTEFLPEARELFKVYSFSKPTPLSRGDGFDIWHLDFEARNRKL